MSEAGPSADDGPEMVQINLRLSQTFLDDIDATWREEGFNSRSEFLRHAARDAVKHPAFSRDGWKQIAASAAERGRDGETLLSREAVLDRIDDTDE